MCLGSGQAVQVGGVWETERVCGGLCGAGRRVDSLAVEGEASWDPYPPPPGWGLMMGEGNPVMDKGKTAFRLWEHGAHRGMLPVQDDLGDVFHRVQKVVVPPLIPVDGHRAIFVHAARGAHSCPRVNRPHLSAAPPSSRRAKGRPVATEEKRQGGSTPHFAQTWHIMAHKNPILIRHRGEGGRQSPG